MFQSFCPIGDTTFRSLHPNVVYIPMFDQFGLFRNAFGDLSAFWRPFRGSKVLSFSTFVHAWAVGHGIASYFARYYPEVPQDRRGAEGLHGFFWLRRELELGWTHVRTLIGTTAFETFHLHLAGDPGFPPVQSPPDGDLSSYNVTISTWFEDRSDFDEVLRRANVYFAPRLSEGIGQSFLEAMARGQCVVAPDGPTMNEYIVHGVNGLLYDLRYPQALDFSDVARLGREAQRGILAGRARWVAGEKALVDFIVTPSAALYAEHEWHGSSLAGRRSGVGGAVRSVSRAARAAVRRHVGM
jgi:glycosyltransferase involved in cell wall biosynthesis